MTSRQKDTSAEARFAGEGALPEAALVADLPRLERARADAGPPPSEEHYRALFDSIDEGFCVVQVLFDGRGRAQDYRFLEVNAAFERQTGLVDAVGKTMRELRPAHESHWFERYGRIALTGIPERFEDAAASLGRFYDVYAFRCGEPADRSVAIIFHDIKERRQVEQALRESEARHAFLLDLSDKLRQMGDPLEIRAVAARLLAERIGAARSLYTEVREDEQLGVVSNDYRRKRASRGTGAYRLEELAASMELLRAGPLVLEDTQSSPMLPLEERAAYAAWEVGSIAAVALERGGKHVAHLSVTRRTPHAWTPFELSLLRDTAERACDSIERARTRAFLGESEEKYRTLFESMDEGFAVVEMIFDPGGKPVDFRILEVNPSQEKLTGVTDVVGNRAREVIGDVEDHWLEAFGRVALTGEPVRLENWAGAIERWLSVSASRVGGESSRRVAVVFDDVTERKSAEEALRRSEARQSFLLKLSDAIRPLADPVEIQGAAARVLCEQLGVDRAFYAELVLEGGTEYYIIEQDYHTPETSSLVGRFPIDSFSRRGTEEHRVGRLVAVADVETDPIITSAERGSFLDIKVRAYVGVPLVKSGRLVAMLGVHQTARRAWTAHEVVLIEETAERTWAAVERARAEEALRQSQLRLERERARLQAIVDTIPVGLFIMDSSGAVELANEEGKRIWAGAVPLRAVSDYSKYKAFYPATGERLRAEEWPAAQALLLGRKTEGLVVDIERFDGTRGTIVVSSAPIRDHVGRIVGVVTANQDITALREAQERLEEADRRKNQFLAMLSHELRNPLTPVKNSLYILDHAAPGGDQARRAKDVITRQIDQLSRLVDDLLDVTRISRGKIQLQRCRLELNELVRRTLEDQRTLFESSEVGIELEPAPQQVFINADWNRVAQVVSNILQNSAKFTPRGGRVTVAVSADAPRRQAVVRVTDTGAGMSRPMLARLFEPFTQADATLDRSNGGLGLGLALVKGLVEQHGGSVQARSDGPGLGSELTVRLPLDLSEPEIGERRRASGPRASRRVLVIEDNVDAADSLGEVLQLHGHHVEVAYSGPEGIAKARELHPEVVLCDIGLPGMDGYAVARAFRAEECLRDVYLVALSGYALPEDLQRAASAGFARHLAKPPSLEKLERVLGDAPDR